MPTARAPVGYRVVVAVVRALLWAARWRVDARGMHHLPASGGAVVTWNHTSHVDFVVTALALYVHTGRWVRFLAMQELWEGPLLRWLPRLVDCIPVDRSTEQGREAALERAVAALADGDLVMVAPEGTISTTAQLLPFHAGAARMAQAAGTPIVPTASWGTHRFSTTGRSPSLRRSWRLPVTVRVGPPLEPEADGDPAVVTQQLRSATRALLDDARAAHPTG